MSTNPYSSNFRLSKARRARGKGLNQTEIAQTQQIAKRVVKGKAEVKHRAWLYPKTTYSELLHNQPYFLFGGPDGQNGLLNLAKGDDSVVHPNGGALPKDAPGSCRDGQSVRVRALTHRCILSGDGPNKNTMVRLIMFSYSTSRNDITEADILLQPTGTGAGQGWPNIFLSKNNYSNKNIKFLMDRTYQLNGQTSGAVVEAEVGTNWGLSGVRTFSFNKYFKNGKRIDYVEQANGDDTPLPAGENIGIMIIPYGSGVSTQGENCGRIEILGDMEFVDL